MRYTLNQLRLVFTIGLIIGIVFGSALIHFRMNLLVKTCELDIPRTQKCELVAVPTKWIPKGNEK